MTSCRSSSTIKHRFRLQLCFFLSVSIFSYASAQQNDAPTLASESLTKAVNHYDNYFGQNLQLYTGPQYTFTYGYVGGHQYFMDDYWEQGSVVFGGQAYDSIFMKYDVFNDILVIEHFGEKGVPMSIKVFSPLIASFMLQNHYFVRLNADSAGVIRDGFYDILFEGDHISAMAKREKEIVRTTSSSSLHDDFLEKDRHFLYKNGLYYPVKKRGSVIKVLVDKKKQVKNFIRTNGLYFALDRDRDLRIVAQYYESLFQ